MKFYRGVFLWMIVLFTSIASFGQSWTVKGVILDKGANEPLIGANVVIKGTTIGSITDWDGG